MATQNQIKHVTQKIVNLVDLLIRTQGMVKGSFATVYRKCGKPTCWCAAPSEKGHISTRITWNENGISRTRTVNETEREWLQNATAEYRTYRLRRRQLRMEKNRLEDLLDKQESEIVKATKD